MKKRIKIIIFEILIIGVLSAFSFSKTISKRNDKILSHIVDLNKQDLRLFWKTENGDIINNFINLKEYLSSKSEKLVFAMNGGMYQKDFSPQGLYIENGIIRSKTNNTVKGYGNFYLQPNGVFYITNDNKGFVCKTTDFKNTNIKYATQSGPLLLIEGKIHSKFRDASKNLNIRNGVGVLPNGRLLFAMSKEKINFYDFAKYFKSFGCKNALYLDGFVSKTYLPEKDWIQTSGNFGVIIGEVQ
ncbi:phosphodiester glycosidase family protein [uncultured Polaribacter sp.]|uniref:phosphodiester glycosidase family protein n=1 Tax=uncultured Polaribacter sp. TaxID=174711 RepID=UPI00262A213F|nr:phosphodiester glycosidase family protein [uncultured Polaribacter sp.]